MPHEFTYPESELIYAFNSLFEMQRRAQTSEESAEVVETFNSLFEMRDVSQPRPAAVAVELSILYLRCHQPQETQAT